MTHLTNSPNVCNAPRHDSYMDTVSSPTTGHHLMMQQKHHITIEYKYSNHSTGYKYPKTMNTKYSNHSTRCKHLKTHAWTYDTLCTCSTTTHQHHHNWIYI